MARISVPAITAVGKGLGAYVAVDACGTFSQTKREVGLLRMLQAGVITTDYASLMVEILRNVPDARHQADLVIDEDERRVLGSHRFVVRWGTVGRRFLPFTAQVGLTPVARRCRPANSTRSTF